MFISEEEKNSRLSGSLSLEPDREVLVSNTEEERAGEVQEGTSTSNLSVISDHRFRGRTKGAKNIPDFLRPIIGASVTFSGNRETQEAFGIGSSASTFSMQHGKTSPEGKLQPELKSKVEQIVGKVQETAAEKLMSALGFITDEKLENAKATDLSSIAANMSRVIEKTTEKKENVAAQIVIYAPSLRTEEKYEIIESN